MHRELNALEAQVFDVIVVGGGFFGAFAAWDAALRGLSVCLVDQGDFCGETSANSYKIVHGGIRYLQHGDLVRVWKSSAERGAFLRISPHLVHPMPVLIPTYGHGKKGKEVLRTGFGLYDALTWNRNQGIPSTGHHIPRAAALSREEALRVFPALDPDGLTGGVLFSDAQMYSPPRIAISALRSAAARGACLANRVQVTGFLRRDDRVIGVQAHDHVEDRGLEIRGTVVVNAAGPWAVEMLDRGLGASATRERPSFSRDVGLVVRRKPETSIGLACPTATKDADSLLDRGGRHLFLLPWRDFTLVGVWHGRYDGPPEGVEVSPGEIEEFLADANRAYPALDLTPDDVVTVHAGLILYNDDSTAGQGHRFGRRSLILDHAVEDGIEGIVTIVGVRATMARYVAEKGIDLATRKIGHFVPSATATTPVFGGDFPDFEDLVAEVSAGGDHELPDPVARSLAHNYGSRYQDVLDVANEGPRLIETIGDSSVLAAEVVHSARHEMALTLGDVIFRRSDLGVGHQPSREDLELSAQLMGDELGWDDTRRWQEVESVMGSVRDGGRFGSNGRTSSGAGSSS